MPDTAAAPAPVAPAPAPSAPAAAPVAPHVPSPPPAMFGHADHMATLDDGAFSSAFGLGELVSTEAAPAAPAPTGTPAATPDARGNLHAPETGQFVAKNVADAQAETLRQAVGPEGATSLHPDEGAESPAELEPVEGEPSNDDAGTEGESSAEIPATPALATEFALEQDGEPVEMPANLTIKFRANGEDKALPLDKVVRLAQRGAYNAEKEAQYTSIQDRNEKLEPFAEEMYRQAAYAEQFLAKILAGGEEADKLLFEARVKHAELTSPEAENARLKQRIAQLEQGGPATQQPSPDGATPHLQQAQRFAAALTPKIEALVAKYPTIGADKVMEHFTSMSRRYLDPSRGIIDPKQYHAVLDLVDGALDFHLESLAEYQAKSTAALDQKEQEVRVTRGQLRLEKRKAAGTMRPNARPSGAPLTGSTAPKAPPPNARAEQVNESLLDSIAAELMGERRAG